jgi:hypothetical protein
MKIELNVNNIVCSFKSESILPDDCETNKIKFNETINDNYLKENLAKLVNITQERLSDFKLIEKKYVNKTSKFNNFSYDKFLTHKVSFTLLNNNKFENETKDNRVVFFNLVQISLVTNEFLGHLFNMFRAMIISDVVEIKNQTKSEWCGQKYDKIERFDYPEFRLLAKSDEKNKTLYFVYVNEKLYKKGEYILALFGLVDLRNEEINLSHYNATKWIKNSSLLDITDLFLSSKSETGKKNFFQSK